MSNTIRQDDLSVDITGLDDSGGSHSSRASQCLRATCRGTRRDLEFLSAYTRVVDSWNESVLNEIFAPLQGS